MTKKRLADLIQEEAQKSEDSETKTIQEATLDQSLEPDTTLSEAEPLGETTVPSQVDTAAALRARRTGPTKGELETTLAELREALQAAHQKENFLQQQIAGLQSDFQEQKKLVQKLQAEIEPANQVKAELEQAKKVILQISEANSKVIQEVNTSRQEDKSSRLQNSRLKKLPNHSIQPDLPSSNISDKDIGWVD